MKFKHAFTAFGMALLVAGPCFAQEARPWGGSLNVVLPLDSLKSITHASGTYGGVNLDFGYTGRLASTPVPLRTSIGINLLPGRTHEGGKASITGYYLASDLMVESGFENLRFLTGLSLNKMRLKAEAPGFSESYSIKGVKFGGRIGFDYRLNEAIQVNGILQVVELGHDRLTEEPVVENGGRGLNPSWFQVGVTYSF